jgi:hypothetical protein
VIAYRPELVGGDVTMFNLPFGNVSLPPGVRVGRAFPELSWRSSWTAVRHRGLREACGVST